MKSSRPSMQFVTRAQFVAVEHVPHLAGGLRVGVTGDDANGGGGVPHEGELLHDLAIDRVRQLAIEFPDARGLLRGGHWITAAGAARLGEDLGGALAVARPGHFQIPTGPRIIRNPLIFPNP